jgi:hypothetical protein
MEAPMSARAFLFAVAVLALAPVEAKAAIDVSTPQPAREANAAPADLTSLFESPADVVVTASGMMVAQAPMHMVMLMRIGEDGTLETACVESAASAEAFLHPKSRTADSRKPVAK